MPRARQADANRPTDASAADVRNPVALSALAAVVVSSALVVLIVISSPRRRAAVRRRIGRPFFARRRGPEMQWKSVAEQAAAQSALPEDLDDPVRVRNAEHPHGGPVLVTVPTHRTAQHRSRQNTELRLIQRCEIALRHSDGERQLVAVDSRGEVEGVSPLFRLRNEEVPNAAAHAALSKLLADLERSGWTIVAVGSTWHGLRLERTKPAP